MTHDPRGEIRQALINAVDGETGDSAIRGDTAPRMKEGSIVPDAARRCS